ncbi:MAG: type III pantothenate kinase [Bacteroidales bacterium]|nr:type III pantothenate kinase [Bacteroidales bacterium]
MNSTKTDLVIDQGNSACKWAFFESTPKAKLDIAGYAGLDPMAVLYTHHPDELLTEETFDQFKPRAAIYSSVLNHSDDSKYEAIKQKIALCCRFDTTTTPIPIKNNYSQPAKLGADRLAAAVGAWTLAPGKSSFIVDLGTAITYDLLSAEGVYEGGNIAPGIFLRTKALHENTKALPLPEMPIGDFPEFGKDTVSAIKAGVLQGILHEINGYILQHQQNHPELLTFLTGGDLIYFVRKLKSGIFARPNLVLTGLHRILIDYVNS